MHEQIIEDLQAELFLRAATSKSDMGAPASASGANSDDPKLDRWNAAARAFDDVTGIVPSATEARIPASQGGGALGPSAGTGARGPLRLRDPIAVSPY